MPTFYDDYDRAAHGLIEYLGKKIVLGIPIGIGKPIGFINALYRLAEIDRSIDLTIITGLTLAKPTYHNELERRFAEPILKRILGDYQDPLYEVARVKQCLPDNIRVIEFFLSPGKFLKNAYVQQNYINSKYTSVIEDVFNLSINALAQQVAVSHNHENKLSLSCNSDLSLDVMRRFNKQPSGSFATVAEVNANLPFMHGEAMLKQEAFTHVVDVKHYRQLFALPLGELSIQDHFIGVYTSTLIKDESCIQIGIGKMGDAIANALIMRHEDNEAYQTLLEDLKVYTKFGMIINKIGETNPFHHGLYGSTEMWSDEYLNLYQHQILKKQVYDNIGLQQLINTGHIKENFSSDILDVLMAEGIINPVLNSKDIEFLIHFGIFKEGINHQDGKLILNYNETYSVDLTNIENKKLILMHCLGKSLKNGKFLHAGFFIGSQKFYKDLQNLDEYELEKIDMTTINRTNRLTWNEPLLKLQRKEARLINSCMMITLNGQLVSDGLKNNLEVSGVGGQFDFVSMAFQLENARSIINCHSTWKRGNKVLSNIVWEYPNITIPHYFKDIFITEYGIADCRGKIDKDSIKAILNITDSRFQRKLLTLAKRYGKIEKHYEIPTIFCQNYPERLQKLAAIWRDKGYLKPYPFGTELTGDEEILKNKLLYLKHCSKWTLLWLMIKGVFLHKSKIKYQVYLKRLDLWSPKNLKEHLLARLIVQLF